MEYRIGGATYSCLMGRQTKFCLQIALLVLIVTLVFVYFKLPSGDSLPDGRSEPSGEPDALDKYLNQQFQFLGVGGKQKNALDPKVKELEQYQQLVQSILHNSDANCRLTEYMIRNGSCKAGINETTSYSDILGTQVYTVMTTCAGEHMKRPWVLFLHGMAYTTRVWVETNIMRMTASFGFNSIAIDLPGFGNSKGSKKVSSEVEFINDLIDSLKITKFVIVSPSMSGRYSIPYLKTLNPKLVGFVAAAPTSTELLTGTDATTIETPVLIMKGERDNQLGKVSLDNLARLKHSTTFIVPDAGHPSYVDNTPVFTREIIKFLLCMSSETQ